jgi:hypothetical protein
MGKNEERVREIMRKYQGINLIRTTLSTPYSPPPTPYSLLPTPLFIFHFSLFTFLLLSCQTAPKTFDSILDEAAFIPLEEGAFAYIIADVPNAKPILNQTSFLKIQTRQLQQMLDKTSSAVVAVYLPQSEKRYRLVSWGDYPATRAKMALALSRDWKKERSTSGAAYWYSAKEGISVALDQRQAWVLSASGGIPLDPFSAGQGASPAGTPFPEGFYIFSRGSVLSFWLNDPGPLLNLKLLEMGLPIEIPAELIFAGIYPADGDRYEALLRIQLSNPSQARGLAAVLNIARAFLTSDSNPAGGNSANGNFDILNAIFFSNPPVQDGRNLNIKTNILSSGEIALLFTLFSL